MTLTSDQLAMRVRSIGSTDSAAILGFYNPDMAHLSKMKNATDVAMRIIHNIDLPGSSVMNRGNIIEPKALKLYNEHVGPCRPSPGTLRHHEHQWMVGSPDGEAGLVLPEFKTVGRWSWDKWGPPTEVNGEGVPDGYLIQVNHLLAVTCLPEAHVLALFGTDFKDDNGEDDFAIDHTAVYLVKRDEELIDEIVSCGRRFMDEFIGPNRLPETKPVKNIKLWKQLLKEQQNGSVANVG